MSLSQEWKRRIEHWIRVIGEISYRPIAQVPLEGFVTKDHFTASQAQEHPGEPMPPGKNWGGMWEYAWFRSAVTVPKEAAGKPFVLRIKPGGDSLVWVDGHIAGSVDWAHQQITLAASADPGKTYQILLESYAGHGPISVGGGPVPNGIEMVPEPVSTPAVVGNSSCGIWLEELFQLGLDISTLYELRNHLEPSSLRVDEIDQGLKAVTNIIDLELPEAELMENVQAGRDRLKPLLECVNGSTAPVLYAFGHAHLDIAWLWPLAETQRKIARTIANQLALIEEYPEYRYQQSQPHLFWMLKNRYPDLYERMRQAVRKGNIVPDGGMWVEADTNISGGESLIRQFIFGKRFFREEFGIDSRILWLPDVFGYSGALPQIMKGCGIEGFGTQKILWTYNGGDPFPYNIFWWEGIDGTAVPAHIFNGYNNECRPSDLVKNFQNRNQKGGVPALIFPFGHGDGGGGPTREHVEYLRRAKDLEGAPRACMAGPEEYFAEIRRLGLPVERYVGELYYQSHRGTYTTQARTKQGNRRAEFALREAELWGSTAAVLTGHAFDGKTLQDAWRKVLLNQFHDIIPGSSIHRVYEEAEAAYAEAIQAAQAEAVTAAQSFISGSEGLTVFNSLSWPRREIVEAPAGTVEGMQLADGKAFAEVLVPPCGWTEIKPLPQSSQQAQVWATDRTLENSYLRITLNNLGEIASLYDKEGRRELAAAPCNAFRMYKDVPGWFDAWDIDSCYEECAVELDAPAEISLIASGPLFASLRLVRKLNNSRLEQTITLRRGSCRLDFVTEIDWRESHKLLKTAFPVNVYAQEAVHEIQFGHLRRPNHSSRPFDADRYEVCNHKWSALVEENRGVAILNDSKYGLNVDENSLNLTLLRSATAPDTFADQGVQKFTYAFFFWNGSFGETDVIREAYALNSPVMVLPGSGGEGSLFAIDAPNIILETVKPAEPDSPLGKGIVLRLYEAKRTASHCELSACIPFVKAVETDMLENPRHDLEIRDGKVLLDFRPFEIKTVFLKVQ
jgi:alpha-mannosidase